MNAPPMAILAAFAAAASFVTTPARAQFGTDYHERGAENHYAVDFLATPPGVAVEVGGMAFLPDGRLVVGTRRGQVWLVENPLAEDPRAARFSLFAEGLHEGLGLAVVDGVIYVVQRAELSRLLDTDGDGRCDRVEVVADDWGVSGNYHEFAYGLPTDAAGNFYVSLNVGFFSPYWYLGQSLAPYRGWVLRISPDGTVTPWACGFRSPNGISITPSGDLFVTDNQGDWVAVCPLYHVRRGGFYGHPASLAWTPRYRAEELPAPWYDPPRVPRTPAAVYIPYGLSRSTGNVVVDESRGDFGPFAGQMLAAELTNGLIVRLQLEKVRGEYQGAAFLFRTGVGAANRVLQAPDGTLLVGLTSRGWGGAGPAHGISRVRYRGVPPFEMHSVHLLQDGFRIRFTRPVKGLEKTQVKVTQYDYAYWWKYGSPELDVRRLGVRSLELSEDGLLATLRLADLRPGYQTRIEWTNVVDRHGVPLVHDRVDYTLNQLPHGPYAAKRIVRVVPPPATREQEAEGWLYLHDDRTTDVWKGEGWRRGRDVRPGDGPGRLRARPGGDALVAAAETASPLRCRLRAADHRLEGELLLPRGGACELVLSGDHRVLLGEGDDRPDNGALVTADGRRMAPRHTAAPRAGKWTPFTVEVRTARPGDGPGGQVSRRLRVSVGGRLLHDLAVDENVDGESPAPAPRPFLTIVPHTQVALRGTRVRAIPPRASEAGWVSLFDGETLAGWKREGDARWVVRDGILEGSGGPGRLVSERADYRDLELRVRCRLGFRGDAGVLVRATSGEEGRNGYEARIRREGGDPARTGSLTSLAPIRTRLIPFDDCWFTQRVLCTDEPDGTRVRIFVNGIQVVDHLDTTRRFARGALVLARYRPGATLQFSEIQVREPATRGR